MTLPNLWELRNELEQQQEKNRATLSGCGVVVFPGVFPDDDEDDDEDWDDDEDKPGEDHCREEDKRASKSA